MSMPNKFDHTRSRKLNQRELGQGPIWYWMSRDQRVEDNWALVFASQLAKQEGRDLGVVFCLQDEFLGAGARQFTFMLEGLKELQSNLQKLQIPFHLLQGKEPEKSLTKFLSKSQSGALVTDFSPLKIKQKWLQKTLKDISIPVFEIDAHNIIPVWQASDKCEFAAHTLRPKIHKLFETYLTDFPELTAFDQKDFYKLYNSQIDWQDLLSKHPLEETYEKRFTGGSNSAFQMLKGFLSSRLTDYHQDRNDPNKEVISDLSPYLHFGQISSQRIALEVTGGKPDQLTQGNQSTQAFLEELVVRKELADNFCYYCSEYDIFDGFHDWAKKTLNQHRKDSRQYLYSYKQLEKAKTHDKLWNAAQLEMLITGKMHGFMRMYWAKKILEWTESPEQALEFTVSLNDTYELDGRDPNGYVGAAWSIGGVHDRAWTERPVFGKIRYMNYNGCKRKFDVDKYIQTIYLKASKLGLTESDKNALL
jgi:deoxyribodipyrimidine photo-lyase